MDRLLKIGLKITFVRERKRKYTTTEEETENESDSFLTHTESGEREEEKATASRRKWRRRILFLWGRTVRKHGGITQKISRQSRKIWSET